MNMSSSIESQDIRIGVVVPADFPTIRQVRPRKIAKKHHANGESCVIFARNDEESRLKEHCSYAEIQRFNWFSDHKYLSKLAYPFPLNPFWILWLLIQFRNTKVDIVIGSDVRAGLPTSIAASALRLPMILDLQENNPERQQRLPFESPIHLVTRNGWFIKQLEHLCIRLSNEVWVVVEDRKEDLILQGITNTIITPIGNMPLLSELNPKNSTNTSNTETTNDQNIPNRNKAKNETLTLLYVGIINEIRGLDDIIRAIPEIQKQGVSVDLLIGGDGYYRLNLEALVRELDLTDTVTFVGMIDYEDVPAFLQNGDIGLILNEINRAHNTTIPNKIFEYMAVQLPVLVTNLRPLRRIVRREQCGVVLPTNADTNQIAETVISMSKLDMETMGKNGRQAVVDKYNWDTEWTKAQDSIERVLKVNG